MTTNFKKSDPVDPYPFYDYQEVLKILHTVGWMTLITSLNFYEHNVALKFSRNLNHNKEEEYATRLEGLRIHINEKNTSSYICISEGLHWGKDDRENEIKEKHDC